jgi:methionine synthase I (cobalamin-dependent)
MGRTMDRFASWFPPGPVLTDGAWGTQLQTIGLTPGESPDLWNLTHASEVESVARSYVAAGSQVILTNTFRANPVALAAHGLASQCEMINREGVLISRRAAEGRARVFASLGPTGKLLATEEIDPAAILAAFRAQAQALAEAGADALLFETFSDPVEAALAAEAALPFGLPILLSFAFDTGKARDRTMTGATPEKAAQAALSAGAAAIGANCGAGPDAFLEIVRRLKAAAPELPIWIKPNAGLPRIEAGTAHYAMTPAEFAGFAPALIQAGARFLGGCCGTSPDFIQALAGAIRCTFSSSVVK